MIALLFYLSASPQQLPSQVRLANDARWTTIKGTGSVSNWAVNDVCTRVRVTYRSGEVKESLLKQHTFQNGDYYLLSLLAVGSGKLLITHNKGIVLLDQSGTIHRNLKKSQFLKREVGQKTVTVSKEGPIDLLGSHLTALAWNGNTALLSNGNSAQHPSEIWLMRSDLTLSHVFFLRNWSLSSVKAKGDGWLVHLSSTSGSKTLHIVNKGSAILGDSEGLNYGPVFTVGDIQWRISGVVQHSNTLIVRERLSGSSLCRLWIGRESGAQVNCFMKLAQEAEWNVQGSDQGFKLGNYSYALVWNGAVTRTLMQWQENSKSPIRLPAHMIVDDPILIADGVVGVASFVEINAPAKQRIFCLTKSGLKWFSWPKGLLGLQPGTQSCYLISKGTAAKIRSVSDLKEALAGMGGAHINPLLKAP